MQMKKYIYKFFTNKNSNVPLLSDSHLNDSFLRVKFSSDVVLAPLHLFHCFKLFISPLSLIFLKHSIAFLTECLINQMPI